jgi:hypothetical protein
MRGGRVPINLTPEQTLLVLLAVLVLVGIFLAFKVLEVVLTRGAALAVRLSGRTPPRKSPTRIALDELEERLRHRE